MIIVVDLKNKKHIIADTYKAVWRKIAIEERWWDGLFEYEREYSFRKKFNVELSDFYEALHTAFENNNVASNIEREVSDMVIDSNLLKENDYKEIISGLPDVYVFSPKQKTIC